MHIVHFIKEMVFKKKSSQAAVVGKADKPEKTKKAKVPEIPTWFPQDLETFMQYTNDDNGDFKSLEELIEMHSPDLSEQDRWALIKTLFDKLRRKAPKMITRNIKTVVDPELLENVSHAIEIKVNQNHPEIIHSATSSTSLNDENIQENNRDQEDDDEVEVNSLPQTTEPDEITEPGETEEEEPKETDVQKEVIIDTEYEQEPWSGPWSNTVKNMLVTLAHSNSLDSAKESLSNFYLKSPKYTEFVNGWLDTHWNDLQSNNRVPTKEHVRDFKSASARAESEYILSWGNIQELPKKEVKMIRGELGDEEFNEKFPDYVAERQKKKTRKQEKAMLEQKMVENNTIVESLPNNDDKLQDSDGDNEEMPAQNLISTKGTDKNVEKEFMCFGNVLSSIAIAAFSHKSLIQGTLIEGRATINKHDFIDKLRVFILSENDYQSLIEKSLTSCQNLPHFQKISEIVNSEEFKDELCELVWIMLNINMRNMNTFIYSVGDRRHNEDDIVGEVIDHSNVYGCAYEVFKKLVPVNAAVNQRFRGLFCFETLTGNQIVNWEKVAYRLPHYIQNHKGLLEERENNHRGKVAVAQKEISQPMTSKE